MRAKIQSNIYSNKVKLVWACAWCSPSTYRQLKKGEEYTHGICLIHKVQLIARAGKLVGRL